MPTFPAMNVRAMHINRAIALAALEYKFGTNANHLTLGIKQGAVLRFPSTMPCFGARSLRRRSVVMSHF